MLTRAIRRAAAPWPFSSNARVQNSQLEQAMAYNSWVESYRQWYTQYSAWHNHHAIQLGAPPMAPPPEPPIQMFAERPRSSPWLPYAVLFGCYILFSIICDFVTVEFVLEDPEEKPAKTSRRTSAKSTKDEGAGTKPHSHSNSSGAPRSIPIEEDDSSEQ